MRCFGELSEVIWRLSCFGHSLEVCLEIVSSLETQLKNGMPPISLRHFKRQKKMDYSQELIKRLDSSLCSVRCGG